MSLNDSYDLELVEHNSVYLNCKLQIECWCSYANFRFQL